MFKLKLYRTAVVLLAVTETFQVPLTCCPAKMENKSNGLTLPLGFANAAEQEGSLDSVTPSSAKLVLMTAAPEQRPS